MRTRSEITEKIREIEADIEQISKEYKPKNTTPEKRMRLLKILQEPYRIRIYALRWVLNDNFTCNSCKHELNTDYLGKRDGYCYLCCPDTTLDECLETKRPI